jgi:hypothetical protein
MTHLICLLIVVAMAGLLCASIWTLDPVEIVKNAQQLRVEKALTLTFR